MDQQKKLVEPIRHSDHPSPDAGSMEQSSGLLQQVQSWGEVARAAYAHCQHGADAEQEVLRRRNRSGQ